jgi:hypothetical protein
MEESIAKRKEKPTKSPDGSTHRKAQKAKTNVIVAKVSPSKTPENNPMSLSKEKNTKLVQMKNSSPIFKVWWLFCFLLDLSHGLGSKLF